MKILVTTPTGRVGQEVLRELLAPEFEVRVILRNPERLPVETRDQLEIVRGSIEDGALLGQSLHGVDSLFWCIPSVGIQEHNVREYYRRMARAASQAVREAQTPRVVSISTIGNGLAPDGGPIAALHEMEEILNRSGAAIRHLRCGSFMENFLKLAPQLAEHGYFSYPIPGNIPVPMVAVRDVADAALRWLVRRDWDGVDAVGVHGPEDLSYNQAAAVIERILERPIRFREVSANLYVQTLVRDGASPDYAKSLVNLFGVLAQGIETAKVRSAECAESMRFFEWVEQKLKPAVDSAGRPLEAAGTCSCRCER